MIPINLYHTSLDNKRGQKENGALSVNTKTRGIYYSDGTDIIPLGHDSFIRKLNSNDNLDEIFEPGTYFWNTGSAPFVGYKKNRRGRI